MSQIKKGAILNYVTILLTTGVGLVLTPFIVRNLGDSQFGLYNLIGALVGYISVLDFGISNAIVRFVAKYRAEQDQKGLTSFLSTTFLIYLAIATVAVIIGVICYFNLDSIFKNSLSLEELSEAKIMFGILIFNLAIGLPGGIFTGICFGFEEFVFPKALNIYRYIIRSIAVLVLLFAGGKAIGLVILDTVFNILIIIITAIYTFKKLKVRFILHQFNKPLVKEIFSYSIWIFVAALISQFQWKAGQLILGIFTDTTMVAIFAIGITLGTYYGAFSGAITGVFLPRATQMTVKQANGQELTDMMIKIGRVSLIVLFFVLIAFLLYGKQFVFLWVGETYYDAWVIASIIMIAYTIPLIQAFGNSILEATNKMSFKVITNVIFIGSGTIVGAILSKTYGGIGMIAGSSIGWFIGQNIMNVYYHKVIKINIPLFFKKVFSKIIPASMLCFLAGYLIDYIPGIGWLNFIVHVTLFAIVYFFIMYLIGMHGYERELFLSPLEKIYFKLKNKNS